MVYLDDILVYSKIEAEYEDHLYLVLSRLHEHIIHAKLNKFMFSISSIEYLGLVDGSVKVWADLSKAAQVNIWSVLTFVKHVQQFFGFSNYYNPYIRILHSY